MTTLQISVLAKMFWQKNIQLPLRRQQANFLACWKTTLRL
jgi:hypothetical protein